MSSYALVFDTSNLYINIGIGEIDFFNKKIDLIDSADFLSNRSSNEKLIPTIKELANKHNISQKDIKICGVGLGPGSFTGVRIAISTAKGISCALNIPLVGFSTLSAIAENLRLNGITGNICILADAMRNEIYPSFFQINSNSIIKKTTDCAMDIDDFIDRGDFKTCSYITGDALLKYANKFGEEDSLLDEKYYYPTGKSCLSLLTNFLNDRNYDVPDFFEFHPDKILPIYTRLSDAEENERKKENIDSPKNLITGVQDLDEKNEFLIEPLFCKDIPFVMQIQFLCFSDDAWTKRQFEEDLSKDNRIWYKASILNKIIGYAGIMRNGNEAELLKICIGKEYRNHGYARALIAQIVDDLRNLNTKSLFLEVKSNNSEAIKFYESCSFERIGIRKNYYKDSDAIIYKLDIDNFVNKNSNIVFNNISDKQPDDRYILAIESSCDETAASILNLDGKVISSIISSSAKFHNRFGGVVPEIASRKHIEVISSICNDCLEQAGLRNYSSLSAIAVTNRPGLVGSLVVGVAFAKAISWAANIPIMYIDHLEGHLYANRFSERKIEMPAIASLVSGGNTVFVKINNWGDYEVVGGSIDDAVGEAYDKLSKTLSLGYPGGPIISSLASKGDPNKYNLPRPMYYSSDLKMSLSGLKTATFLEIEKIKAQNLITIEKEVLTKKQTSDICAAFENSICDVMVKKAKQAIIENGAKTFCFGGGVAANSRLRSRLSQMCKELSIKFVVAPIEYCGDNASMIGLVACDLYRNKKFGNLEEDVSSKSELVYKSL